MPQNRNAFTPEAATDEPASPANQLDPAPAPDPDANQPSPRFASRAEEESFWRGVNHGLRCRARIEPGHLPAGFEPDELGRSGADPGPVSASLADAYVPVATDAAGRAIRADGFTPERQCIFLSALARCGVVADACRVAGVSRDTAYNLRDRAEGAAFALAWDSALLISRGRLADELMSRGMNGCIDRIYRNGELVAERHRHDNRLAMAILTRLDRQAEAMGEGAAVARTIAREWDQFLDIVRAGGDDAGAFLSIRAAPPRSETVREEAEPAPDAAALAAAARILDRLDTYRDFGHGVLEEADKSDLDLDSMTAWTPEQWHRADYGGLLDALDQENWPETAWKLTDEEENGSCPIRQDISDGPATGLGRLRREYFARFDGPPPSETAGDGFDIWEDEDEGCWVTNYPPPEDFDGFQEGEWGDDDYKRSLCPEEQAAHEAELAASCAAEAEDRARELAEAGAARDLHFGLAGAGPDGGTVPVSGDCPHFPLTDAAQSAIPGAATVREGTSG